jgi:hypothetical protein
LFCAGRVELLGFRSLLGYQVPGQVPAARRFLKKLFLEAMAGPGTHQVEAQGFDQFGADFE